MNKLVIVESPAKVKTIKKFLGSGYQVMASNGHVRDMPKSQLGIGPENDYEPKYITIRGKGPILSELRKEAKKADKIYLATDPDREGEAISWHLTKSINLEGKKVSRITFNEITQKAVKEALKNARVIDQNLVDAQQARRALDRIVGYKISPLLWEKVKNGLSAGRVQSAALKIIGEKEKDIAEFIPREYWSLDVILAKDALDAEQFKAAFYGTKDGKQEIHTEDQAGKIQKVLENGDFEVESCKKSTRKSNSPLPFTTSTLQQEAANNLNFTTQKTMRIAQQLYEGIEIKGEGTIGIITYLRTDSTRISDEAKQAATAYIEKEYGSEFVQEQIKEKEKQSKIQDAHEAIRPTDVKRLPQDIKEYLSRDQYKLYNLIWKRFVASCMSSAVYEICSVKMKCDEFYFTSSMSRLQFQGYMQVYKQELEENSGTVPNGLEKGTQLKLLEVMPKQHFTQPQPHYTEASLVKKMEELGIGRPSTYSPIITTLLKRRYITKEGKNLYITEIGEIVNDMMQKAFPTIVDVQFTAVMEGLLDSVAEGKLEWKTVIRNFYPDVETAVKEARQELEPVKIQDEETDVICEQCGKNMVIKYGPHGRFLACPEFPECRYTKPYLEKIGIPCPECNGELVAKTTKKGRRFYGCENYPECEFVSWQKPTIEKCPECGDYMVQKGKYIVCSRKGCGFKKEEERE